MYRILLVIVIVLQGCSYNSSEFYRTVPSGAERSTRPSQAEQRDLTSNSSLSVLIYRSTSLSNISNARKIGKVDPRAVLENTQYGKSLLQSLKELVVKRKKSLEETETYFRSEETAIKQLTSQKDKEERTKKFVNQIEEYKALADQFNKELRKEQEEVVQKFMGRLQYVTDKVAKAKELDIVIDSMEGSPPEAKKALTPLGSEILERPSENLTPLMIRELGAAL